MTFHQAVLRLLMPQHLCPFGNVGKFFYKLKSPRSGLWQGLHTPQLQFALPDEKFRLQNHEWQPSSQQATELGISGRIVAFGGFIEGRPD
jgi:hypothetical protein